MSRMEASEKRRIVEALILSSAEPLSAARIAEIIPYCDAGQAKDLVNELNTEYAEQDRSFEIWEVAGGYQIRTRAEFSGYLQKLQKERALRLSQAALETMAIIAYRQPVTRAEIEDVRGVDAGATVKSLLDRHLIRIAGQREVPGRPMLYGTTRRFLEVFGLERLKDLPTLRELDELAREQGLLEKTAEDAAPAEGEEAVDGGAADSEAASESVATEAEADVDTESVTETAEGQGETIIDAAETLADEAAPAEISGETPESDSAAVSVEEGDGSSDASGASDGEDDASRV